MSGEIINELNIFAKAIMLGVVCGFAYDCLRIIRRIFSRNCIRMGIEDLLYWCIMAIVMCVFLYNSNGGVIRSYIISGIAIGMILYELSIGRFIVKFLTIALKWLIEKSKKILNKIWKILYWGLKKIFKPIKIVGNILNVKIFKKLRRSSHEKRGAVIEKKKHKKKSKTKKKHS